MDGTKNMVLPRKYLHDPQHFPAHKGEAMTIHENNVYRFTWKPEEYKRRLDPNWCWDGQLVVFKNSQSELMLYDTYWCKPEKSFTLEEILKMGNIKLICNLNDVEIVPETILKYYDDADIFNLSYQHGCYKKYVLRKGAQKSQKKMIQTLRNQIQGLENEIHYKSNALKTAKENLQKVQDGDYLNIYI